MRMEHIAINVPDPAAAAEWYAKHLGMKVVRKMEDAPFVHFVADSVGNVMFELYRNEAAPVPDYASMDPLVLHFAFASKDVPADRDRLVAAGATAAGDLLNTPDGDQLAMLRDPWGVAIQLANRRKAMP